jgi:hypothetical protein
MIAVILYQKIIESNCGKIWLPQIGFVYLQGKTGESPNIN